MIKQEIHFFFTALMFYTRIPCPCWVEHSDENLNKSRKYFPLIGWMIGSIGIGILFIFHLALPLSISLLSSIAATVYATGAFHEDGFTDTCDAFGGGWTKEQILTIMKDSRIGAYGVIGILLLIGLKFSALYEIGLQSFPLLLVTYINGHIVSRFIASTFIQTHAYVQDLDKSKSKPITANKLGKSEMLYSATFMLLGWLLFHPNYWPIAAFPVAHLSKIYLGYYFRKRIGGYTGDCLGATQQISEVIFYLSILALCKFI